MGHPPIDVFKGGAVGDGIGENDACGSFVISLSDIFEALLSGCIPDLQFVASVAYGHGFDFEIDSDGGDVGLLEGAFTEASDEYSFSDGAVSDDDDFGHEIVFLCFFRGVHSDIMMLVVL